MSARHFGFRVFVYLLFIGATTSFSVHAQDANTANEPLKVNVVFPQKLSNERTLAFSGTIEAKQRAQISTLEQGIVASINVDVGDFVQQGQVLLSLDKRLATLSVEAAKASLQAAEVNLAEAKRLYQEVLALSENQVVPQTLILERAAVQSGAQAAFARERANLALQEELLSRHTLRAPFSGVIAMRSTEVGEWLTVQAPAFELVNNKDLRLNLSIAQEFYQEFSSRSNIPVSIQADAGGPTINASISRLVPVTNRTNRSFLAQIDLPANTPLIAGMSARANVGMGSSGGKEVELPRSAIKQHPDGGSSVFIVDNGVAKRLIVDYSTAANGNVIVKLNDSALANRQFIVSGVELLRDGDKVQANVIKSGLN